MLILLPDRFTASHFGNHLNFFLRLVYSHQVFVLTAVVVFYRVTATLV
jgi:hypothetical protein